METYDQAWVDAHVAQTTELWRDTSPLSVHLAHRYQPAEQDLREQAYDEALESVESDLQRQLNARERLVASFGHFAAKAFDLNGEAIDLLTDEFLPIGTQLGRWARQFDPGLPMADIIQASRNAWTACGLQPLLGEKVELTPSILGYSMMYPYSDNYLDDEEISAQTKRRFSQSFRRRLLGESLPATNHRERAIWKLIALVESQYPRAHFPNVFECLLAIHKAQEQSIEQLSNTQPATEAEVLRMSCEKGGSSVLADACLANGFLTNAESKFAFEWGVLLQLGDDLQDLRDDMRRGSTTIFSRTVAAGNPLDAAALQLLSFSEKVGRHMDELPHGTATLKELLKMSWRSLILRAVADSHEFFSPGFLQVAEQSSPFRFSFLRSRSDRLASRHGLYTTMFSDLISTSEAVDEVLVTD